MREEEEGDQLRFQFKSIRLTNATKYFQSHVHPLSLLFRTPSMFASALLFSSLHLDRKRKGKEREEKTKGQEGKFKDASCIMCQIRAISKCRIIQSRCLIIQECNWIPEGAY